MPRSGTLRTLWGISFFPEGGGIDRPDAGRWRGSVDSPSLPGGVWHFAISAGFYTIRVPVAQRDGGVFWPGQRQEGGGAIGLPESMLAVWLPHSGSTLPAPPVRWRRGSASEN